MRLKLSILQKECSDFSYSSQNKLAVDFLKTVSQSLHVKYELHPLL
jgi:hypothetical protein